MGVAERKAREQAALTEAVVDCVEQIAADEGWDAVTIRRVSDAVEWSPPKLYALFGDKAGLAAAARRRAFAHLLADLTAVDEPDPAARLTALAEAHWRFAAASPTRFQLMHGLAPAPRADDADPHSIEDARQAFDSLTEAIAGLVPSRRGRQRLRDEEEVRTQAQLLWATLYGIVALHLTGQLPPDTDGLDLTRKAVHNAIATAQGRGTRAGGHSR